MNQRWITGTHRRRQSISYVSFKSMKLGESEKQSESGKKKICTWIVSWIEKQTIFLFYRYANVCSIPNSPLNKFHIIPFPRNSSYSCKWNLEWSRRQESPQLLSCTPVSCVCVCVGGSNTQQFSGTYWYSRGPQLIEYWEGLGA